MRHVGCIVLGLSVVLAAATASAASNFANRGVKVITGTVSFDSTSGEQKMGSAKQDLPDTTKLDFGPGFGIFVAPGFLVGGNLLFERETSSDDSGDETTSGLGVRLTPAYYFSVEPTRHYFVYARAIAGYASGSVESDPNQGSGSKTDVSRTEFGGGAGLSIVFGKKVGGFVQVGIDYLKRNLTFENDPDDIEKSTGTFQLATQFGLFLP